MPQVVRARPRSGLARGARAALASLLLLGVATHARAAIEIPALSGPVIDQVGLLSASEVRALATQIEALRPAAQMQIWITGSLGGDAIESVSMRAAERWKLGSTARDEGLIILIAPVERRMRIEVGQGLEGAIPDAVAARVIRGILTPAFRAERYGEGLRSAVDALGQLARGEAAQIPEARGRPGATRGGGLLVLLFPLLFPLALLLSHATRGTRRVRRGAWGGGLGGGFGGFGGFGGGGWSGGGGGFSGGGGSGSW